MKFCAAHWAEVNRAIKVLGLFDYVSHHTPEAVDEALRCAVLSVFSGEDLGKKDENFDPLVVVHLTFAIRMIACGWGPRALVRCPVCIAVEQGHSDWIKEALDASVKAVAEFPPSYPDPD